MDGGRSRSGSRVTGHEVLPIEMPATAPVTFLDWRPSFSKYLGFGNANGTSID